MNGAHEGNALRGSDLILFGLRSPLVVDYEIAAARSGTDIAYGVSVAGHPRVLTDIEIVDVSIPRSYEMRCRTRMTA